MALAYIKKTRQTQGKVADSLPARGNLSMGDSDDDELDHLDASRPVWACLEYIFIQSTDLPSGYWIWIRVIVNSVLTGLLQAGCSAYLSPSGWISLRYTAPIAWLLFAFGWYSICVAQMVLTR